LRTLADQSTRSRTGVLVLVGCIIACLLQCIANILQYFNTYAFCQVAIYGKPFCDAAKDTWQMFQTHGIDAIINDCIVHRVIVICVILGGLLSAGFSYLICWNIINSYYPIPVIACVIGLFLGFFVLCIVLQVIESGIVTIFVCFAMEPGALNANAPELYNKLRESYNAIFTTYGL